MDFQIQLPIFRGPLDLLLYLVRKHEVEVTEVSLGAVTDQYLAYLEVLQELDLNTVGDFLEIASTLVEIKSRMVLPRGGEEVEEPLDDARADLVRQLLEYKKYRDAASMLEERGRDWQERFGRLANPAPARPGDPAEEPIREIELWDLVGAFSRIVREHGATPLPSIVYDDTPIHVYMSQIRQRLLEQRQMTFRDLFRPGMRKSQLVGIFLALLELVRHQKAVARQERLFGEIVIVAGEQLDQAIDPDAVDNYDHPHLEDAAPVPVKGNSAELGEP